MAWSTRYYDLSFTFDLSSNVLYTLPKKQNEFSELTFPEVKIGVSAISKHVEMDKTIVSQIIHSIFAEAMNVCIYIPTLTSHS